MIVAYDKDGQAVMKFNNSTEAGIWAELPTGDIEGAMRLDEYIFGFLYKETDQDIDCPSWESLYESRENRQAMKALSLITNLDKDGFVYDAEISEIIGAEDIYERYFKPITTREIFEALRDSTKKKWAIINRMDEQKKEIDQLLISQDPETKKGEPCRYIQLADVKPFLEDAKEALGLAEDDEIAECVDEGYLGKFNDICYFAVKELNQPFTLEQWRGEVNSSK